MVDYLEAIRRESRRFGEMLHTGDPAARVPSCPEWSLADLGYHLAEVQHFWAAIAGRLLEDPGEVEEVARPADDAEVADLFDRAASALLTALAERSPQDRCWSWDPAGGTVAWVLRRQAHEALIHRVDAELGAGADHDLIGPELAADGVDEIVSVMLAGVPEWGTFSPEGTIVRLEAQDTGDCWDVMLGRFTGTSPTTGTTYDLDAMDLLSTPAEPATTIRAGAAELDLWLWGRGDPAALEVTGDASIPRRIRTMAAESTQ
jgi:uncharacterized protein (TIGR03083 family)